MAHRVSWELAHGQPPKDKALHRCDNPPCVRPDHLFDGTHADNMRDRNQKQRQHSGAKVGPVMWGSKNGRSKLSEDQVHEIRRRYSSGGISQLKLAEDYGVNQTKISAVVRGRSYVEVVG